MIALVVSLIVAVVAFAGGYQFADGRAAKREVIAAVAAQEAYHAKEQQYAEVAARLEKSKTTNHRVASTTAKQAAAIGNRALYMRDCFDADGLRIANDALRNATTTRGADTKMPTIDPP